MLKKTFCLLFLIGCFTLTGCDQDILPSSSEIEQYAVMEISGFDRSSEDPSFLEVTFLTELPQSHTGSDSTGSAPDRHIISSASGPTLFEAERKLKANLDKKVFFGYVDYFLIGEDAAKDDLVKYLDFLTRNHEIRFSPKIYIIKGSSAKDFIYQTNSEDTYLMERLDNIQEDFSLHSNFSEVNILDVAAMLNDENTAAVIPALISADQTNRKMLGGTLPEKIVHTDGYAVIKDFKLVGYFDASCARGYNFLLSKVKSGAVNVIDSSGNNVSLEIINETTKITAKFNGDSLESVTYHVHIYSNVVEQQSREDIYTISSLENLYKQQSDIIKTEMETVIGLSKDFGIDSIELGKRLRMKHPYKWEKIKDNWREVFTNLDISVEVTSSPRRTYDLLEPNGYIMRND